MTKLQDLLAKTDALLRTCHQLEDALQNVARERSAAGKTHNYWVMAYKALKASNLLDEINQQIETELDK